MYSEKFLKILKLLASQFLVMLQTFFTQGAPKGKLGTPLRHSGTRALEALWHSKGICALCHSKHLGIRALEHLSHSGTQTVLGHSGTQGTEALGHSGNLELEADSLKC